MKKNMGTLDRIIRTLVAVILGVLVYTGAISGLVATIAAGVAIIFVLTSLVSFCPLYKPLGLSSCARK